MFEDYLKELEPRFRRLALRINDLATGQNI
jgi:hypothetical protein